MLLCTDNSNGCQNHRADYGDDEAASFSKEDTVQILDTTSFNTVQPPYKELIYQLRRIKFLQALTKGYVAVIGLNKV